MTDLVYGGLPRCQDEAARRFGKGRVGFWVVSTDERFSQICLASSVTSASWWRVGFGRVSLDSDLSFRRCGEAVVSVSLSPWCLGFGLGLNPFQDVPRRSSTSRRAAVVSSLAVSDASFLDGA